MEWKQNHFRKLLSYIGLWLSLFSNPQILADQSVLSLRVASQNYRLAPPSWQNSSSQVITSLTFNFDGYVGPTADTDVNSNTTLVKLIGATAYPASVSVIRPRGCSIGTTSVANTRVHLMVDDVAVTSNTTISIPDTNLKAYGLRFAKTGNYGLATGAVSCTILGRLRYVY